MTPEEFFTQADSEGMDYYLLGYASPNLLESITDPELADLALDAQIALEELDTYRRDNDIPYL